MAGRVQNLNDGRIEALNAFRNASDKLGDILAEAGINDGTQTNEHGELVNEEGLPIIDINEPVDEFTMTPALTATDNLEDNLPRRFSQLSPEARMVERMRRNKILQMLEDEEEREEIKLREERLLQKQHQRERAQNEMQRLMVNQAVKLEQRKKDKELEKKMAKALVGSVESPQAQVEPGARKAKKSVSFAEPDKTEHSSAQAKYPSAVRSNPTSGKVSGTKFPMRKEVVERLAPKSSSKLDMDMEHSALAEASSMNTTLLKEKVGVQLKEDMKDSDDESEASTASDSTVLDDIEDDIILSAQRHRELALEYHQRREALIANTGKLSLDELDLPKPKPDITDWDKEDVPLEATLAHAPPKSSVSKFKSSITGKKDFSTISSNSVTNHLSNSGLTLPPDTLINSVRMGSVADGKLIASPDDDEDVDTEAQEEEAIRNLLSRSVEQYGGIVSGALGPSSSNLNQPQKEATSSQAASQHLRPNAKPKISRFKVNRNQMGRPESSSSMTQPSAIPMVVGYSSPSPQSGMDLNTPPADNVRSSPKIITEARAANGSPSYTTINSLHTPLSSEKIETHHSQTTSQSSIPSAMQMVLDSPSFPPPTMPSMIIDSPSFPPPMTSSSSSAFSMRRSITTPQHASVQPVASGSVLERKSTIVPVPSRKSPQGSVMTNTVRERVVEKGQGHRRPKG